MPSALEASRAARLATTKRDVPKNRSEHKRIKISTPPPPSAHKNTPPDEVWLPTVGGLDMALEACDEICIRGGSIPGDILTSQIILIKTPGTGWCFCNSQSML